MMNPIPSPLILGHRGAPRSAPENTLLSFARALEQGADGVELDIQRSRDGIPVVIHDDDLSRTMGANGTISRLGWPAVERLTNALVPSFQQAVAWAAASGAFLNVEMKAGSVERTVIDLILSAGIEERVVISSFDSSIVRAVGALAPALRRFLLTERWDDPARQASDDCGAQGICLRDDAASPEALETLQRAALPVIVWTVNVPKRVRELLAAGVAGIITDDPAMAAAVRREFA